jgi:hypothetical protein
MQNQTKLFAGVAGAGENVREANKLVLFMGTPIRYKLGLVNE